MIYETWYKAVIKAKTGFIEVLASMSYDNIVVPLDLGGCSAARLKLAASFAVRFNTRLIGIAAREVSRPYAHGKGGLITPEMIDSERSRAILELSHIEEIFHKDTQCIGDARYYSALMDPEEFLIQKTRTADLVICNRKYIGNIDEWFSELSPGTLLLRLGCPIFILPLGLDTVAARRVVVAWKDTREARRALRESQGFLKKSDVVFIVTVGPDTDADSARDVVDILNKKGICSKLVVLDKGRLRVSSVIINFAASEGADLLITGAYGHTRFHEIVYGSVTQDLLDNSPISCLVAH